MLYISELNQGKVEGTKEYGIWSQDWKRVHNVDLSKEQHKSLCKKRKKITSVNWMQVLAHSDEDAGTGQYAKDTATLKELNNK